MRTTSVTGTAETKVALDMIVCRVSLSHEDEEPAKAKEMSDDAVKAITRLRAKLDIKPGDLETGTLSIHKQYHEVSRASGT